MTEMEERVARAIATRRAEIMLGAEPMTQTADERELARAAIAAMLHPTEEMIDKGASVDDSSGDFSIGRTAAHRSWRAMVYEALVK